MSDTVTYRFQCLNVTQIKSKKHTTKKAANHNFIYMKKKLNQQNLFTRPESTVCHSNKKVKL